MRIRFKVNDDVWYGCSEDLVINSIVDSIQVDIEKQEVLCSILVPENFGDIPRPKNINQNELHKTFHAALRSNIQENKR